MKLNHLSPRLATVAEQVSLNARIADIGSDHAYVPIWLAQQKQIQFGVVGEVAPGPLANAEKDIISAQLANVLMPRLADGLAAIHDGDNVDTIIIAGMGGSLIRRILTEGHQQLVHHPKLILQPNINIDEVRQWLADHHYQITHEAIISEPHHIYEILVAEWSSEPIHYSKLELQFGPYLLKQRAPIFIEKWQHRRQRCQYALDQMMSANDVPDDKVAVVQEEIKMIDEVLDDARN